ncbi:hypothetical protein D3C71_1988200 [compost metagenome]
MNGADRHLASFVPLIMLDGKTEAHPRNIAPLDKLPQIVAVGGIRDVDFAEQSLAVFGET